MQLHSTSSLHRRVAMLRPCLRPLMLALCSAGFMSATMAQVAPPVVPTNALPVVRAPETSTGNVAVRGTVTMTTTGTDVVNPKMDFTQTSTRAVVEFNSFQIGAASKVTNTALHSTDITLFRVVTNAPAAIAGGLTANNQLMLVAPGGVYVSKGAKIEAISGGSILLSVKDLSNYDSFMTDPFIVFDGGSEYGYGGQYGGPVVDIEQGAQIVTGDGGAIMLIGGRGVRNQGDLTVGSGGQVVLAAAGSTRVEIPLGDSGYISVVPKNTFTGATDNITRVAINTGTITAPNGHVFVAAAGSGSGANVYNDLGNQSGVSAPVTQLFQNFPGSSAINTGTINAQSGTVHMMAKGLRGLAANLGKVNVSALDEASKAGSIVMSGERVRVAGLDNQNTGELLANGPSEGAGDGGSIELGDSQAARDDGNSTVTSWVYVSKDSTVSANAGSSTGNGGTVNLVATGGEQFGPPGNGQQGPALVEVYGTVSAQGRGDQSKGGQVLTQGDVVNLRYNDMFGSIQVGGGGNGQRGKWTLFSPGVKIGPNGLKDPTGEGQSYLPSTPGSYVHHDEINNVLNTGGDVEISTLIRGPRVSSTSDILLESGTQISRTLGASDARLSLIAGRDIVVNGGSGISSTSGKLHVNMQADATGTGQGSIRMGVGQLIPSLLLSEIGTQALAVAPPGRVTISTNGGDVILSGATVPEGGLASAPFNDAPGVDIRGTTIATQVVQAGAASATPGNITITGAGGAGNVEVGGQHGVQLSNSTLINGRDVTIVGRSADATGVSVSDTQITSSAGTVAINGSADSGSLHGVQLSGVTAISGHDVSLVGQSAGGAGVIATDATISALGGNLTINGASKSGTGVSLNNTKVSAAGGLVAMTGIVDAGGLQGVQLAGGTTVSGRDVSIVGRSVEGTNGISVSNSTVAANGGDAQLNGTSDVGYGISLVGSTITAGAGKVTLTGVSGNEGLPGIQLSEGTSVAGRDVSLDGQSVAGVGVRIIGSSVSADGGDASILGQSVGAAGVVVTGSSISAGAGKVDIVGHATGARNGVQLAGGTDISGRNVSIYGQSGGASGVSVSDTSIATDIGTVDLMGLSQSGAAPVGVDIGSGVEINMGQGRATILGRAEQTLPSATSVNPPVANGVRINDVLIIRTSGGPAEARQQLTLAGETTGSKGAGVQVVNADRGIRLFGDSQVVNDVQTNLSSVANVVVGGSAGAAAAPMAIDLGKPSWNTTGSVNIRPLGVISSGPKTLQLVEQLGKKIRVGAPTTGAGTNFIVKPEWFVNSTTATPMLLGSVAVIGSDQHTGLISVETGALNGAGSVTLQNEGNGSDGIQLGGQPQSIQTLSLLTAGGVTQSGPISVQTLNAKVGPQSKLLLNDRGNQISVISFNRGASNLVLASQARPSAQSNDGVLGYHVDAAPSSNRFQAQAITYNGEGLEPPVRPHPVFESTDSLNDLRTDVYLRGVSKPQVCTPSNTVTGAMSGAEASVDPLALEWSKVRRGAQLTNCSGVRSESNCSAF